jgi:hypothetical protein
VIDNGISKNETSASTTSSSHDRNYIVKFISDKKLPIIEITYNIKQGFAQISVIAFKEESGRTADKRNRLFDDGQLESH